MPDTTRGERAAGQRTRLAVESALRAQRHGHETRQPSTPRVANPTTLLLDAISDRAYRFAFAADSPQQPVRWRIVDGSPPAGFAVEVTDGTGATATQRVRLVVHPAPDRWWGTALTWLWRGITYLGYLLLLLMLSTLVFGAAPSEGHAGLIGWLRNR